MHERDYLSRVISWPPAGDPNAFCSIHWTFTPKDHDPAKLYPWGGEAVHTLDEALDVIERAKRNPSNRDIYVCMGKQRVAAAAQTKSGRAYYKAVRNQNNTAELKSLFIDIDVKPGAYADTEEAVRALIAFCQASGLPRPTLMVFSGSGGLHVYWCLDRGLTPNEWHPLAQSLAEAGRRHGLIADWGCTVDSARILRVPGTTNHKVHLPVRMGQSVVPHDYPVATIAAALAQYLPAKPLGGLAPRPPLAVVTNELSAGIVREARPVVLRTVAEGCGFVKEALDTGGAGFSQPLWNLTTLLATFTEEGLQGAHDMAKGHAGYTQQSTMDLFDRKLREREQGNIGWPTCQTISTNGCGHCASCPHLAAGKSPLHLGRMAAAPNHVHADTDLPRGYTRIDGIINQLIPTGVPGQNEFRPLCRYKMLDGWAQGHPWVLHFQTETEPGVASTIAVPAFVNANREKLQVKLAEQGLMTSGTEAAALQTFFMSWIKQLQDQKKVRVGVPFGWMQRGEEYVSFSHGGRAYLPDGSDEPAPRPDSGAELEVMFTPRGTIDPWMWLKDHVLGQKRQDMAAIIATAFAGPLVLFTGSNGNLVPFISATSGIGKSAATDIAAAVWGAPGMAVMKVGSTENKTRKFTEDMKNLPVYYDEMRNMDEKEQLSRLVFGITSGSQKGRLRSDATYQKQGAPFSTLVVCSSNSSLWEVMKDQTIGTEAGALRVYEVHCFEKELDKNDPINVVVSTKVQHLNNNFGHAGTIYAKFLVQNVQRIRREVNALATAMLTKYCRNQSERYYAYTMVCMILGAKYANECGIGGFDVPALKDFLIANLGKLHDKLDSSNANVQKRENAAEILTQFFKSTRFRNTLVTDRIPMGAGRPRPVTVLEPVDKMDRLQVHVGTHQGVVRFSTTCFNKFLKDSRYQIGIITDALVKEFGMVAINGGILGAGTAYASGKERLWELNTTSIDYLNALTEEFTSKKEK